MKKFLLTTSILVNFSITNAEINLDTVSIKGERLENKLEIKVSQKHTFDSDYISKQSISNIKDLLNRVPGAMTQESFSSITIRGITNFNSSQYVYGRHGAIGYSRNGVPLSSIAVMHLSPSSWDVKKVLVLKGATPTALKIPTMGGATIVNTAKPSFEDNKVKTKFEVGQYNSIFMGGAFNQKINDNNAIRVAISQEKSDGDVTYNFDGIEKPAGVTTDTLSTLSNKKASKTDDLSIIIKTKTKLRNGGEVNLLFMRDKSNTQKYVPVNNIDKMTTRHVKLPTNQFVNNSFSGNYFKTIDSTSSVKIHFSTQSGKYDTYYGWWGKRDFGKESITSSYTPSAGRQVSYALTSPISDNAKISYTNADGTKGTDITINSVGETISTSNNFYKTVTDSSGDNTYQKYVKIEKDSGGFNYIYKEESGVEITQNSSTDLTQEKKLNDAFLNNFEKRYKWEKSFRTFSSKETTFSITYDKELAKGKASVTLAHDILKTNRFYDYDWKLNHDKTSITGSQLDSSKTTSVYGNYTLPLNKKTTALIGGRYVIEKSSVKTTLTATNKFLLPSIALIHNLDSKTKLSASHRWGYQSGGVKKVNNELKKYKAEKMKTTELTVSHKLNSKTNISATAFHNLYIDKQETIGIYPNAYIANVGKGNSKGLELSVEYKINNTVVLNANSTHLKTKYTKGANKGKEFKMAPKTTYNINLAYDDGKYFGSANLNYRSNMQYENTDGKAPSSSLVDVKAGIKQGNIKYYAGINNIFNKKRITHGSNSRADNQLHHYMGKVSSRYIFAGIEAEF